MTPSLAYYTFSTSKSLLSFMLRNERYIGRTVWNTAGR
jgi:hypothetical protein